MVGKSQKFNLRAMMAGVTFSDSDAAPVPTFLNPDQGPKVFQIWKSDSCSDSGYHRSKRNLPIFLLKKWPRRFLLCQNLKVTPDPGPDFTNFRLRLRKKNAESCQSRLQHSGSIVTSAYKHVD